MSANLKATVERGGGGGDKNRDQSRGSSETAEATNRAVRPNDNGSETDSSTGSCDITVHEAAVPTGHVRLVAAAADAVHAAGSTSGSSSPAVSSGALPGAVSMPVSAKPADVVTSPASAPTSLVAVSAGSVTAHTEPAETTSPAASVPLAAATTSPAAPASLAAATTSPGAPVPLAVAAGALKPRGKRTSTVIESDDETNDDCA
jgi:hypothetical protein